MAEWKHRKAKRKPDEYFVQIYHQFLDEPAWLALSFGARCLYVLLKSYYNSQNNGKLFLNTSAAATPTAVNLISDQE